MQVYHHIPYGKIIFYLFTILFHLYLLVRAAAEARYLVAAILIIPVTSVSLVLFKFLKKTLIYVFLNGSSLELATVFERFNSEIREMKVEGREVITSGMKFSINPRKAHSLIQALNHNN